jgi:hypothetical protein
LTTTINASPTNGLVQTADGSGVLKVQSNGVTTNALAWVRFNGSTSAIASSYNVSSITKNGTTDYTVTMTTATTDANYAVVAMNNVTTYTSLKAATTPTTTAFTIITGGASDTTIMSAIVFGN